MCSILTHPCSPNQTALSTQKSISVNFGLMKWQIVIEFEKWFLHMLERCQKCHFSVASFGSRYYFIRSRDYYNFCFWDAFLVAAGCFLFVHLILETSDILYHQPFTSSFSPYLTFVRQIEIPFVGSEDKKFLIYTLCCVEVKGGKEKLLEFLSSKSSAILPKLFITSHYLHCQMLWTEEWELSKTNSGKVWKKNLRKVSKTYLGDLQTVIGDRQAAVAREVFLGKFPFLFSSSNY